MKPAWPTLIALTLAVGSATAQPVLRPKPGAIAPNAQLSLDKQMLDPTTLSKRLRAAPKFLTKAQLGAQTGGNVDTDAGFKVTPAQQKIAGRGALAIEGQIILTHPAWPDFPGQATIRSHGGSSMGATIQWGKATLTFAAQKDQAYVVDCLTLVTGGGRINFAITGAGAATEGTTDPVDGHLIFNVRRPATNGDIQIMFRPKNPGNDAYGHYTADALDLWGCQVSPA